MPSAAFHSNYWAGSADAPPPAASTAEPGYPIWQASVICGSGFGASQVVWEWLRDQVVTTTQEKR